MWPSWHPLLEASLLDHPVPERVVRVAPARRRVPVPNLQLSIPVNLTHSSHMEGREFFPGQISILCVCVCVTLGARVRPDPGGWRACARPRACARAQSRKSRLEMPTMQQQQFCNDPENKSVLSYKRILCLLCSECICIFELSSSNFHAAAAQWTLCPHLIGLHNPEWRHQSLG